MIETLEELRLADVALEDEKKISFFVENQFPAIYRENGRELIELVKSYYRFLEQNDAQSVYNIRRIYEYRNIDTTLNDMLIFFKNKFLNGLFFEEDTRFIVKNILDLYRRKGSSEGIELFFKLFFDSEVEIFFPSQDMFKPSTSLWKTGSFIQMYPTTDISVFSDIVNRKIFGDKTNAEAFVDSIYFVNIKGSYVPILFISDVKGEFAGFDSVYSIDPIIFYGRVYGSLRSVRIENVGAAPGGNKVGDSVDIISTSGAGAKGRISKVTQDLSGEINFTVEDGNYGYTLANTDIIVSNQNVFFSGQEGFDFRVNERISQINSANTEIFATVIGRKSDSIGILLDDLQDDQYFFENGIEIQTVSRDENISRLPLFVTLKNTTASAEIGTIKNTETITIITDLIENYLNVPLNSSNYSLVPPAELEMSGTRVDANTEPTLNTPLNVAFVPETFTIGEIDTLTNINPGFDLVSDVFVLARENIFRRFNLQDQILNLTIPPGVLLIEGDIITQTKQVQDFEGNLITTQVKGRIVGASGNNRTVKQLTFESFIVSEPIFKQGVNIAITVNSRSRDFNSPPLGLNAIINGNVETVTGKIQEIEVIDSGIGYEDGSLVKLVNRKERETNIDFSLVSQGILQAAVGQEPGKTLFDVVIPETDKPLGDINQNGVITSQDALEMVRFVNGAQTDKSILDYITDIFIPFLMANEQTYSQFFIPPEFDSDLITDGIAQSRRQGITEGRWRSFFSHTNQEKVLQDSFFYQDYSYELSTDIETNIYEDEYRNLMHPSGLKLFTKFSKIDIINMDIDILNSIINLYDEDETLIVLSQANELFDEIVVLNTGFQYLSSSVGNEN